MDDYFLMSDEALERLYRDLENDIQRFSDDDLRDPRSLNWVRMEWIWF